MTINSEDYRRQLLAHNDACQAALVATSEPIRAYIRKRFRVDLYPLDFVTDMIAGLEALVRTSGAVTAADSALDPVAAERPQEQLRAPNDSPESTLSLAALPAQEEASFPICHACGHQHFFENDHDVRPWGRCRQCGCGTPTYELSSAPAAPHDTRETTEGQKHQEDTRETPSSTLSSPGSTAKNLNGR